MTAPTTQIKRPSTVFAEYWPANVLMPDGTIRRRARVYLTDTGAHLFFTKPVDDLAPGFTAPIDFEATNPPDIHAFNVGVDIVLARTQPEALEGQVLQPLPLMVITPTGGCGCGSTLKTWKPSWSSSISPWPGS